MQIFIFLSYLFLIPISYSQSIELNQEQLIKDLLESQNEETNQKNFNIKIDLWDIGYNAGVTADSETDRSIFISALLIKEHPIESMFLLCHEFGHHLGGKPFIPEKNFNLSVEGQADFYASRCLKNFFLQYPGYLEIVSEEFIEKSRTKIIDQVCASSFANSMDFHICSASIKASYLLIKLLSEWGEKAIPKLFSPEDNPVEKTILKGYPSLQCRLNTFTSGALCSEIDFNQCIKPSCWFKE